MKCHPICLLPILGILLSARFSFSTVPKENLTSVSFPQPNLSSESPTLDLMRVGSLWEHVIDDEEPIFRETTLYSQHGDDLFIRCTAPYPIQWNLTGIIIPTEVVKIQLPKRDRNTDIFEIQVNIFFATAKDFSGLAASGIIACEKIGQPKYRKEVAVFVKGNSDKSMVTTKSPTLSDDDVTLIPCATTDPRSLPTLYFSDTEAGIDTKVENVVYSPISGFHYPDQGPFRAGAYICKTDSQSINVTVPKILESFSFEEYQVAPTSNLIRRFSDEFIQFECSSKENVVIIEVNGNSNDTITTVVKNSGKYKVVQLKVKSPTKQLTIKGTALCITEEGEVIKRWSWEFLEPPQLYLDNEFGEINCLSPLDRKFVQTIRCGNEMECEFARKQCFQNDAACNFRTQKLFFSDYPTNCWAEELRNSYPCVGIPFNHASGFVQCGALGLKRHWEFFISLEYKRYVNWKDADERELIQMEEIFEKKNGSRISTDSRFICRASSYLFADSLHFQVVFRNGSHSIMEPTASNDKNLKQKRPVREIYVETTLNRKEIPEDAVTIKCVAPFWNNTESLAVVQELTKSCI